MHTVPIYARSGDQLVRRGWPSLPLDPGAVPVDPPIAPPVTFTVTAAETALAVDWEDVPAPAGNFGRYEIQWDTDSDPSGRPVATSGSVSAFTIKDLPAVDHWLRVRVVTSAGTPGEWSAVQGPYTPLPVPVAPEPEPSGVRGKTAAEWPFTSTSPANMPAPTDPVLEPASGPMTTNMRQAKGYVNQGRYGHGVYYSSYSDPLCDIVDSKDSNRTTKGYVPLSIAAASGSDGHAHVVQPDGKTILEMIGFSRASDTRVNVTRVHKVDLYGDGLGPANGVRAWGGSAIIGLIRKWMVNDGVIPTPVAWAFGFDQLKHMPDPRLDSPWGYWTSGTTDQTGQPGWPTGSRRYGLVDGRSGGGFIKRQMRWPVSEEDYGAPGNYRGQLPMGAYLLIPRTVDPGPMNLQPATRMVFDAMQNYGGYALDTTAAGNLATLYVEIGAPSWFRSQLVGSDYSGREVQKLLNVMRVVVPSSNTAATPNGASLDAPRMRPLAGPIGS